MLLYLNHEMLICRFKNAEHAFKRAFVLEHKFYMHA